MDDPSAAPRADPPLESASASILIVDDDADQVRLLRAMLEDAGYRVEGVLDGSVALARLRQEPLPDLLVVDLMMPVMDGWRFIAELKAQPALSEIPVVVMSGAGGRALSSAPVSAGYLEKPVEAARLLETIAACLVRKERKTSGTRRVAD